MYSTRANQAFFSFSFENGPKTHRIDASHLPMTPHFAVHENNLKEWRMAHWGRVTSDDENIAEVFEGENSVRVMADGKVGLIC